MTSDPTVTEAGGLSAVGHGVYSCMFLPSRLSEGELMRLQTALRKQLAFTSLDNKHRNLLHEISWSTVLLRKSASESFLLKSIS